MQKGNNKSIRAFSSFQEENQAEYQRLAKMSPVERWKEFALLQERVWGTAWTAGRIKITASWERPAW